MSRWLSCVCAIALVGAGSAASAAPISAATAATGSATLMRPLTVTKKVDMDFGSLIVTGAGTAVIDPLTGTLTTSGGLTAFGSAARAATFTAVGTKNSVVLIRVPKAPILVTRVGGTETMSVSSWTLDGPANRRVPLNQTLDFSVGASLTVGAAQVDGTYTGSFDIEVQYP